MSDSIQTIACLGPEGSFSHEFALSHFGDDCEFLCIDGDFAEVIDKVGDGTKFYLDRIFIRAGNAGIERQAPRCRSVCRHVLFR